MDDTLMGLALSNALKTASLEINRWKACVCPSCGWVQVTEAKRFTCRRCSHSAEFRMNGMKHVEYFDFGSFKEAQEHYRKLSVSKEIKHDRYI